MKVLTILVAAAGLLVFNSCERHEWEGTEDEPGTKALFPSHHGDHGSHSESKSENKTEN